MFSQSLFKEISCSYPACRTIKDSVCTAGIVDSSLDHTAIIIGAWINSGVWFDALAFILHVYYVCGAHDERDSYGDSRSMKKIG
ncbi:hypothetical protein BO94DRAFT_21263 [Aspergillus sclerotioniger CBS 115572]|uniref:Uncharacterized protein n=1 Tax=Aspergillus sclerotioniger CBS 115572 TaxID=1450535 RepID=A0A317WV79_9EURO|nr:hypothetical protein BO94DRAFT_21263 [Aspergillus sclerotioniger CBS 115572]PWY90266.1 hypothetical protein BO94DRAFT_21263 [Aspergillus sclerotioniger CBS 115572]